MNLRLVTVGRPRNAHLAALHDDYADRIRRFGVGWETRAVPEEKASGRYSEEHLRAREARAIERALDDGEAVVLLDPAGKMLSSDELAARLPRWAAPRAALVVGGPSGLHPGLSSRATAAWSLSRLTFPHELVRVLVAEQVYRALCIARRVPYHR